MTLVKRNKVLIVVLPFAKMIPSLLNMLLAAEAFSSSARWLSSHEEISERYK